ncbi:MAG: enoyl-CoA hydratase/isomerase family protein [Deltaproteobacteria bacterium]|nr:enoyl-CoA hydratase/isomerase family protein [Deltaproteobacteria bacterium]MBW2398897.1 enoyl-CoA hydratase/isomerase family protein [Deltaproteobacteria bacterium]
MHYETIESTMDGHVGILAFDRADVLNAFNAAMIEEVNDAMTRFAGDEEVRAVLVHGKGRAFSAGFDLKESADRTEATLEQWREILERDFEFIMQFWDHPKPTVAAVHGFCLAGAFELALACDLTVAAEGTRFGEPEVRFGAGIVAMLLPWSVGPKKAKELILTGNDGVSAEEALAMGAVNRVVSVETVLDEGLRLAKDMSAAAAPAVRASKRAINRTYDIMGMRQALLAALETDLVITAAGGPEKAEFNRIRGEQGLKAALAWRDAKFR